MCGIAGWIDWEEDVSGKAAIVETMIGRLSHRGPDAHAIWLSKRAALAHHRLIVIDPVSGGQPMVYQAGEQTSVITYNGELHNFRELRGELENRGHTFHTHSDRLMRGCRSIISAFANGTYHTDGSASWVLRNFGRRSSRTLSSGLMQVSSKLDDFPSNKTER
jgi:asparagine synthetase B (glutamine-hydrolysing)